LLQFVIRIWLPVGWSLPHTNLQFPFFLQYIFLFFTGIVAYQNNWLEAITLRMAKPSRSRRFAIGVPFKRTGRIILPKNDV